MTFLLVSFNWFSRESYFPDKKLTAVSISLSLVVSPSNFAFIGESSCFKRSYTCSRVSFDAINGKFSVNGGVARKRGRPPLHHMLIPSCLKTQKILDLSANPSYAEVKENWESLFSTYQHNVHLVSPAEAKISTFHRHKTTMHSFQKPSVRFDSTLHNI